jgi:hypothetical protein
MSRAMGWDGMGWGGVCVCRAVVSSNSAPTRFTRSTISWVETRATRTTGTHARPRPLCLCAVVLIRAWAWGCVRYFTYEVHTTFAFTGTSADTMTFSSVCRHSRAGGTEGVGRAGQGSDACWAAWLVVVVVVAVVGGAIR